MAESSSYRNPSPSSSSRLGGGLRKNNAAAVVGEIVEVEGGHIVRSTGRKDRHSKVCTAKGPRDRRVRLAAHTAIQFYDVQDRLGYDRPSKAVDWLMKKAKAAIDELAELPAWHPTATNVSFEPENAQRKLEDEYHQQRQQQHNIHHHHQADLMVSGSWSRRAMPTFGGGENEQISSFLPPSMDSDVIANTIKSFFPMGGAGSAADESSSSTMQFQNNNIQDLRLSLQSFQDPNFLRHHHTPPPPHANPCHHHHHSEQQAQVQGQHVLQSGTPLGFDSWTTQPDHPSWNSGGVSSAGFMFNSPAASQQVLGGNQNQFFTTSQRGPLQSSNTPSLIRAWMDPPSAIADQHHHPGAFPSSVSGGIGFASGYGGFYSTGFHIPTRIQGDEEEHDGYSDKPSSASSGSRHL